MIQITATAYAVIVLVIIMIFVACYENKIKFLIWLVSDFSGIRFIYRKINPEENEIKAKGDYKKPATAVIWLVVIYIAAFVVASDKYEGRIDVIEDRINGIYAQSSRYLDLAFERIDDTQNMPCPVKPVISAPGSIINSFLSSKEAKYEEGVEQLKRLVEDWAQRTETIKSRLQKEPLAEVWIKKIKGTVRYGKLKYDKKIGQLAYVDLQKVNLEGAELKEAHLEVADLSHARLSGAELESANLDSANLWYAHLDGADLRSANLENADLRSAYLADANLWFTNLKDADLRSVNFEHATLRYAHLTDANLRYANFEKADLSYAYLKRANLAKTNLEDADLKFINLENANLEGANLENACLCEADLKNANVTLDQLSTASSLYGVKNLDSTLKTQLREQYPHLFEPDECDDKFKTEGFLK